MVLKKKGNAINYNAIMPMSIRGGAFTSAAAAAWSYAICVNTTQGGSSVAARVDRFGGGRGGGGGNGGNGGTTIAVSRFL